MRRLGPALLAAAATLLVAGVLRGEAGWVLRYVQILCLSCMGLGR